MDYSESRLSHYYIRYVIDDCPPPRGVITAGPLNHSRFQDYINLSRKSDGAITIISVVSILNYPYDHKGISDRRLMYKVQNKK